MRLDAISTGPPPPWDAAGLIEAAIARAAAEGD
jgi:hypothetical protein